MFYSTNIIKQSDLLIKIDFLNKKLRLIGYKQSLRYSLASNEPKELTSEHSIKQAPIKPKKQKES